MNTTISAKDSESLDSPTPFDEWCPGSDKEGTVLPTKAGLIVHCPVCHKALGTVENRVSMTPQHVKAITD